MVTSDHVTKMAVTPFNPPYPKTPCYTQTLWLFVFLEPELLPMEVLHCGNKYFPPPCSYDPDLDPMTFIDEHDWYSQEIYRMCKYELPAPRR